MTDRLQLIETLKRGDTAVDPRVFAVLADAKTRQVGTEQLSFSSVEQTSSLWAIRLEINQETDHPLHGGEQLLRALSELAPHDKVRQLNFVGEAYVCTLFFAVATGKLLGTTFIRRRTEEEENARRARFEQRTYA